MSGIERHEIGDTHATSRRALLVALLVLGSPAAFLVALGLRYSLAETACRGVGGRIAMEGSSVIAIAVAAVVLHTSWRRLARAGERFEPAAARPVADTRAEHGRFVLVSALLTSALFLLAGVALILPSFFLSPCGP